MPGTRPNDATLRALLPANRDAAATARWIAEYRALVPALSELARTTNDPTLLDGLAEACGVVLSALGPNADPRRRAWVLAERANAQRWSGGSGGVDEALVKRAIAAFDKALIILAPAMVPRVHALNLKRHGAAVSILRGQCQNEETIRGAVERFDAAEAEPALAALIFDHGTACLNHANGLARRFGVTRDSRWLRRRQMGMCRPMTGRTGSSSLACKRRTRAPLWKLTRLARRR